MVNLLIYSWFDLYLQQRNCMYIFKKTYSNNLYLQQRNCTYTFKQLDYVPKVHYLPKVHTPQLLYFCNNNTHSSHLDL